MFRKPFATIAASQPYESHDPGCSTLFAMPQLHPFRSHRYLWTSSQQDTCSLMSIPCLMAASCSTLRYGTPHSMFSLRLLCHPLHPSSLPPPPASFPLIYYVSTLRMLRIRCLNLSLHLCMLSHVPMPSIISLHMVYMPPIPVGLCIVATTLRTSCDVRIYCR